MSSGRDPMAAFCRTFEAPSLFPSHRSTIAATLFPSTGAGRPTAAEKY
jgi:hypothetical protein